MFVTYSSYVAFLKKMLLITWKLCMRVLNSLVLKLSTLI